MPETEFSAFMEFEALKAKHDYMQQFGVETDADIARTLAMFGGFTEGLQLFASFAMLMNFPRFNKMKGMGQIVSLERARREPALRGDDQALPRLQRRDRRGDQGRAPTTSSTAARPWSSLEDRFIDLAFEAGEVQGMTPDRHQAPTSASSPTGACASSACRPSTA